MMIRQCAALRLQQQTNGPRMQRKGPNRGGQQGRLGPAVERAAAEDAVTWSVEMAIPAAGMLRGIVSAGPIAKSRPFTR